MLGALSRALRRLAGNNALLLAALGACSFGHAGMLVCHNQLLTAHAELAPALDYRASGYSAEDVAAVLGGYGQAGRRTYAAFEALDLLVFVPSYALLLAILLSRGCELLAFEPAKLANLLPLAAAAADAAENCLMLAMLAAYPSLLPRAAPAVVCASRVKWGLLYASCSVLGGVGLYVMAVAAGLAGGRGGSRAAAAGQPPHPQQARKGAGSSSGGRRGSGSSSSSRKKQR